MGVTTKDRGVLGTEIICEPDDDYGYVRCASKVGVFYLRFHDDDDTVNVWAFTDGIGFWDHRDMSFAEMCHKDEVDMITITERTSDTLLSKEQFYASKNN